MTSIDFTCISCVLKRVQNGADVEGGKGATNRLWMRSGRLYGDPVCDFVKISYEHLECRMDHTHGHVSRHQLRRSFIHS